jgi:transposase
LLRCPSGRVSKATVNNWRRGLREDGRRHAKALGRGPVPRLDAGARAVLRELVTADNDATLVEYRDQLRERTGISVSPAVLCITLQRLALPRKKRHFGRRNKRGKRLPRSETILA